MEYGYTHEVGGTPNKVKSTTDSSLIGSGVLSMGMEGIFHGVEGYPFYPMGKGVGYPPHHMLKISPQLKDTLLPQLNAVYTRRYCQYVTLYTAMTQDQVIEM